MALAPWGTSAQHLAEAAVTVLPKLPSQRTAAVSVEESQTTLLLWSSLFVADSVHQARRGWDKFSYFLGEMKAQQEKLGPSAKFVRQLYMQAHKKMLATYTPHAMMGDLLDRGAYDCLSATTLFALLLRELNMPFEAYETNFHAYIKVGTDNGEVLIETTDPITGFITSPKEIAHYEAQYKAENQEPFITYDGEEALAPLNIHQPVGLGELAGLLWYNKAVAFINNGEMKPAHELLGKAMAMYPSQRIQLLYGLTGKWAN